MNPEELVTEDAAGITSNTYYSPLEIIFREHLDKMPIVLLRRTLSTFDYVQEDEVGDHVHYEVQRRMAAADDLVRIHLGEDKPWTYEKHDSDVWERIYSEQLEKYRMPAN